MLEKSDMYYPKQFGQPCWEKEHVAKVITLTAKTSKESVPYFLAAHSPFKEIKDAKRKRTITEEKIFQDIFSCTGEVMGCVKGEVGMGKSHLIRWLKLRADAGASDNEHGLEKFKIIMVERGNGSLKNVLEQIVKQLGPKFKQHLKGINNAIDNISAKTARYNLVGKLNIVIEHMWVDDFGRKELPNYISALGPALRDNGFIKWLARDEGVVARIIERLTEGGTKEEREKNVEFCYEELIPDDIYRLKCSQNIEEFIDDLEEMDVWSKQAVDTLNTALKDAIGELTGLKGSALFKIFEEIRHELHNQGKQLGIFIEDVSVTGFDQDIFNAFECRKGSNLCRMVALLGITTGAWKFKLQDNQRQRPTHIYDVGDYETSQWLTDSNEIARFAARYLNAVRWEDDKINELARDRFRTDVSRSKCDECKHKDLCFKTFGCTKMKDDVSVGLFPLSQVAASKLLNGLSEKRYQSPRGFIEGVLEPALVENYHQFALNKFPDDSFGVNQIALTYWPNFEHKYLGGNEWSQHSDKERIKFLATFWIEANSETDAAQKLEPFLKPLGLPKFSAQIEEKDKEVKKEKEKEKEREKERGGEEDVKLKKLQASIDKWYKGNQLMSDSEIRTLITSQLIRNSIFWQDKREIPKHEYIRLIQDQGNEYIKIEGQLRASRSKCWYELPRNDETHKLLISLIFFTFKGRKSWSFEGGEMHKRIVYRWIRKNQQKILDSLEPTPTSLKQDAVKCGTQLLALATILRTHSALPEEPQKVIAELFSELWDEGNKPQVLTGDLKLLIENIEIQWEDVKKLLVAELGVGQGGSAPRDFIDPLPILNTLETFEERLDVPPQEIGQSFWGPRFSAVTKFGGYAELHKALEQENEKIKEHLEILKKFLLECGFKDDDLRKELEGCIKELIELIQIEIQGRGVNIYYEDFDELWESKRLQTNWNDWGECMVQAAKVVADPKDIKILCFDPTPLKEACDDLASVIKEYVKRIEEQLSLEEQPKGDIQGGTEDELIEELKQICEILDKEL